MARTAFRRKRRDTKVGSVEGTYGRDFGVRSDMKLGTLLHRTGCESLNELRQLSTNTIQQRLARAVPRATEEMGYLEQLLIRQNLRPQEEERIRKARAEYEELLRGGWPGGDPRFYYGGSFAKKTAIRASFDLDMVLYFPSSTTLTVEGCYEETERRLRSARCKPWRKNVALRVDLERGFHIDIVPGKSLSSDPRYALLYASGHRTTRQTSIELHVGAVRDGGYRDVIKIMKLWRLRQGVKIGSFTIELAVAQALRATPETEFEVQVRRVLAYLRDEFVSARLVDPANSNNVVSDSITVEAKRSVAAAAARACSEKSWDRIVWA